MNNFKTLSELEGIDSCVIPYDSHLVTTCCRLYQKPLYLFDTEDLRIMIGQNIGLIYLIPLAIEVLQMNPLAEGAYYAGDLLDVVLSSKPKFWVQNPELKVKIEDIVSNTINELQRKIQKFKAIHIQ